MDERSITLTITSAADPACCAVTKSPGSAYTPVTIPEIVLFKRVSSSSASFIFLFRSRSSRFRWVPETISLSISTSTSARLKRCWLSSRIATVSPEETLSPTETRILSMYPAMGKARSAAPAGSIFPLISIPSRLLRISTSAKETVPPSEAAESVEDRKTDKYTINAAAASSTKNEMPRMIFDFPVTGLTSNKKFHLLQ